MMASFSSTANKYDGYKSMLHQPNILTMIKHLRKRTKHWNLQDMFQTNTVVFFFCFDFNLAAMKIWQYYLDCALILLIF